jgi:hypothetical protein
MKTGAVAHFFFTGSIGTSWMTGAWQSRFRVICYHMDLVRENLCATFFVAISISRTSDPTNFPYLWTFAMHMDSSPENLNSQVDFHVSRHVQIQEKMTDDVIDCANASFPPHFVS